MALELLEGRFSLAIVAAFGAVVVGDSESVVTSNGVVLRLWTRVSETEWLNAGVRDARELIACWEHW